MQTMDKQGPAPKGKAPKSKGKPRAESITDFGVSYEKGGPDHQGDYRVMVKGVPKSLEVASVERGTFDTELGPIGCWNLVWSDGSHSRHKTLSAAKQAVAERLLAIVAREIEGKPKVAGVSSAQGGGTG